MNWSSSGSACAGSARPARGQGRRRPGAGSSGGVQGLPSGARRKQRRGPALVRRADGVHGAVTGPSSRGAGAPLSAAVQGQAFAGDVRRRRSGAADIPLVGLAAVGRAAAGAPAVGLEDAGAGEDFVPRVTEENRERGEQDRGERREADRGGLGSIHSVKDKVGAFLSFPGTGV